MEHRLKTLEVIVNRLMRRSRKVATAIITPYPISGCASGDDVKGDVLKYMFPADGIITKGIICFDRKVKGGVVVVVDVANEIGRTRKDLIVDRKTVNISPNTGVLAGDRLTVSVFPMQDDQQINEVWISFLWTPHVSETKVKQHLIKELDEAEKQFKVIRETLPVGKEDA